MGKIKYSLRAVFIATAAVACVLGALTWVKPHFAILMTFTATFTFLIGVELFARRHTWLERTFYALAFVAMCCATISIPVLYYVYLPALGFWE